MDSSSSAIDIARERAGDLPCRFEVSRIPPIPPGPFDVVLLLETMLAFPDKETLLQEIARALTTGGRFAFTMEEGLPLTEAERERMPDADTVWLTPLPEMLACLERVGLVVRWQEDCSRSHRAVADSLIDAFAADATDIAAQIGRRALEELLAAHRLWSDWLRDGRVPQVRVRCGEDGDATGRARDLSCGAVRSACEACSSTAVAEPEYGSFALDFVSNVARSSGHELAAVGNVLRELQLRRDLPVRDQQLQRAGRLRALHRACSPSTSTRARSTESTSRV